MTIVEKLTAGPLPRWFWPLLLGLNFLLHAPFFRLPPAGIHVWRQCNTMAVARNFYDEGMNILEPRVDRRNTTNGITGMQFPSYEWLVAGSYHLLGFHESLPRLINWLIYMAGVLAFYQLVRRVSGADWLGAVGAWCLAWSPEMYYHGINALPDVLALTASVAGLLWFVRWRESRHSGLLLLSLLAVTLGGLTKLQFLVVGVPIAVFVVRDLLQGRLSWPALAGLAAYALVAVGVPLAWYAYAINLIKASGLADFGLEIRSATDVATALAIIKRNLVSDWPELLLGYGGLGLLLVGLWRLLRHAPTHHAWFLPGVAWAGALLAYYLIELHQMQAHTYYMLPLLPVLLLLGVWGAAWLRRFPRAHGLFLALLLVQPGWAFIRIGWNRWLKGGPAIAPELFNPATRAALEAVTPPAALCLVGPDDSGCEYFYFLHKKGFGFDRPEQLLEKRSAGQPYVAECVTRGARYLYSDDSTTLRDPRLQPYLAREVTRVGDFQVWELRAAPAQP
ncbi:glycosyltransferase family 39 protein [Hymenobacter sp. BT664]|uniref:Glycosyltransferase family 39 protein n=1 Tax=Hymenobacter montanus TaxID=2771359 RepID=A0A927BFS8_9BACT|nr:glycosyltransferase family 39 protein [Hymenobacter montanus]MBD2770075.1 glycosyltransferase family 39 protein [Hymenobacter montanus]